MNTNYKSNIIAKWHWQILSAACLSAFLFITASFAKTPAAPGDLDLSFGNGGKVITPIGISDDFAYSVAFQSDGKIVAVGSSYNGANYDFAVVRYNTDGTLDTSFGGTGKVVTAVGSFGSAANSVAIQSDGKIVAAGSSDNVANRDFAVIRLNPNGTLDTSFNGTGKVITPIGSSHETAQSVAIQSDGKIVAAGGTRGTDDDFAVVRYNTNGTLDTSFGGTGKVVTPIGSSFDFANSVAIQSDGKIVVAGSSSSANSDFAVVRYNTNGTLDTSFNGTGKVVTPVGSAFDYASSVAIQPDGKIVAAGSSFNGANNDFAVVRYNTNGTLDTSFNGTGKVVTPIGSSSDDYAAEVAIQSDGKIVAAGGSRGADYDFAVVRYNTNGTLDTSFNGTGKVVTPIGSRGDRANSVAIQPDGKIVAAGQSNNGFNHDFALVRYLGGSNANLRTPFDYDGDGKTDISVARPSNAVWTIQNSSGTPPYSFAQFGETADAITPADYDGDGKTDVSIFRQSTGLWYWQRSIDGAVAGYQFGTSGDKPVPADYDGDGKADLTIFRPSTGMWWIYRSSDNQAQAIQFGLAEDIPTPGDFDGDGKADIALYRPSNAVFYRLNSSTGEFYAVQFGSAGDKPTPADFDGDGKTDVAIFKPSNGSWYMYNSSNGTVNGVAFGLNGDKPVAGDYDGDGKADQAVFRPSNATWYMLQSTAGFSAQQFGTSEDRPTPNAFVP